MQSKDRTYQVIAIVALVIGVCALTVGFAAFTQNLTISSAAEVSPGSSVLDVVFSTTNSSVSPGTITPTVTGTDATGGSATLDNTTITGLKANFTEPGQKVTYEFNVYNNSEFSAYLRGVTFDNVSGQSVEKYCAPKAGSSNPATTGYTDACNGITLKLYVGNSYSLVNGATTDVADATIGDTNGLATKTGYPVKVEIEYATGSATADGDFTVSFGDIKLSYSSVKLGS